MKKKIVGILVMMLMITTAIQTVVALNNYYVNSDIVGEPPKIKITDPPLGRLKITRSPDVYVSGYITDDLGINGFGVTCVYADGTGSGFFNSISPPDKYYTFEIHENVKWGPNYLTISATDADGNSVEKEITLLYRTVKDKTIDIPFLTFLENHPNLFPLLRQILGI